MPLRKRSQARSLALQALCLYDSLGHTFDEQVDRFLSDTVAQHDVGIDAPLPPEAVSFARQLATGAWQKRSEHDALLERAIIGWSLTRIAPVDRNILRLGLHELLEQPDTPPQVVINEAIELARKFGDQDSPAFVNGVLDTLRRELGIEITPGAAGGRDSDHGPAL